ncbi:glycosyltransferase family 2 protein [Acinetobacter guillouiae]|uniref:glycosyltransferase family 2 protein n=1 Tax=Acinetobacter guillouiae TaxID=106649 RepID=UPI003AF7F480
MKPSISAVIVLFRPDLIFVNNLIENLLSQVVNIILVDNTPLKLKTYKEDFFKKPNIYYIDLQDNLGIATAHNKGIRKALELKSKFVIIFDQDSSIETGFINSLLDVSKLLTSLGKKVAAIGPSYIDIKTNQVAPAIQFNGLKVNRIYPDPKNIFTQADYIISSGTLIETSVFDNIGLMMDDLFIDYVDVEWGLRAKKMGFYCYIANQVMMRHSIGDESIKVPLSKKHVNIHSDFRKYFIIRNAVYLILYSNLPLNWRVVQIPKTLMYFSFLFLYVKPRLNNVKIFFKALKDGVSKKLGRGSM